MQLHICTYILSKLHTNILHASQAMLPQHVRTYPVRTVHYVVQLCNYSYSFYVRIYYIAITTCYRPTTTTVVSVLKKDTTKWTPVREQAKSLLHDSITHSSRWVLVLCACHYFDMYIHMQSCESKQKIIWEAHRNCGHQSQERTGHCYSSKDRETKILLQPAF